HRRRRRGRVAAVPRSPRAHLLGVERFRLRQTLSGGMGADLAAGGGASLRRLRALCARGRRRGHYPLDPRLPGEAPAEGAAMNIAAHLPEMARRHPDALAVAVQGGGKGQYQEYTLRQLDEESDRLAHGLMAL